MKVGIVGASGYAGAELLRLCLGHPDLEVAWAAAGSQAGIRIADLYPNVGRACPDLVFSNFEPAMSEGVDVVFLALPHGRSQEVAAKIMDQGTALIDLGADFRLRDPAVYERWYGHSHLAPELLGRFTYGLPEINRTEIVGARSVASPGCYPTAAILALGPLTAAGAIEGEGVIVDAASGVSGAGRGLTHGTHFGTANEDFRAYGLLDHRHTPEIEQGTGLQVLFTPHLAPMTRGILVTCYARPTKETSTDNLLALLQSRYQAEPFVAVVEDIGTKATWGSNAVHLTARYDRRTGWVMVLAALDNLVKGAAGQALQCANLMLGLPETTGLSAIGVYP